ncbi:MAG: fatty acid hydroxylase [Candidatus Kapabacteria bacterium]|nr:fatty acid hydroxylase [Candidatus Kapabacteria bacterium]
MSGDVVSKRDESLRLFQNPVLEYFTHVHPVTPLVVFTPIVGVSLYSAALTLTWTAAAIAFWVGVVLWSFTEYTLHRWVFHYSPRSAIGQRLHFLVHGIHHAYPRDSTRLVMPPLVSVPLAALFWAAFTSAFGAWSSGIFAGFIVGYLCYDMIHYATHHLPMRSRAGRYLRRYHMNHHFVDDTTAYGVSNPMWDVIFATTPARRTVTGDSSKGGLHGATGRSDEIAKEHHHGTIER